MTAGLDGGGPVCRICGEPLGPGRNDAAESGDGAGLCPLDRAIREEARRRMQAAREAGTDSEERDRLLSRL